MRWPPAPLITCRLGCGKTAPQTVHRRFRRSLNNLLEEREKWAAHWWACRPCLRALLKRRPGEPQDVRLVDLHEFDACCRAVSDLLDLRGCWGRRVEETAREGVEVSLEVCFGKWYEAEDHAEQVLALLRPRFGRVEVSE